MRLIFAFCLACSLGLPAVCQRMEVFLNQGEIHANSLLIENRRILIDAGSRIAFWDIDRGMLLRAFDMHNQFISGTPASQRPIAVSNTGKFFVTGTLDSVYIYDVDTQSLSFRFKNPVNPFTGGLFSFTRDENYLVYSSNDHINFLNTTTWDTVGVAPIQTEFTDVPVVTGNHLLIKQQNAVNDYMIRNKKTDQAVVRVKIDSSKLEMFTRTRFVPFDEDRVIALFQGKATQVALVNLKANETEKVFSFPFETERFQWDSVSRWLAFTPDPYKANDRQLIFVNLSTGKTGTWTVSAEMKNGLEKGAYGDTRMEAENFIVNCHDEKKIRGFHLASGKEWNVDADIQLGWMHFTNGKILYRTSEDRDKKQYRVLDPATGKISFLNAGLVTYLPLHSLSHKDKMSAIEKRAANRYALGFFSGNQIFSPLKLMETTTLPVASRVVGKVGSSYVIKLSPPKTVIDEANEFWDVFQGFDPLSQLPDRYVTHDITTGESENLKSMNIDERIASEGYFYTHSSKNQYGYETADSIALVDIASSRLVASVSGSQIDSVFGYNSSSLNLVKEVHFAPDRKSIIFLINMQLYVLEIRGSSLAGLRTADLQALTGKYPMNSRIMYINNGRNILLHNGGMSDNSVFTIDIKSLTVVKTFLSQSIITVNARSYPYAIVTPSGRAELWNIETNKMIKDYPWVNRTWMMNSETAMFSDDGRHFVIHEAAGVVTVCNTVDGKTVYGWKGFDQLKIVSFRGSFLYCLNESGVPFVTDILTKTRTKFSSPLATHQEVESEFLNEKDSLLCTAGAGDINIWNLKSKKLFRRIFLIDSTNLFVMNDSLYYTMGKENMGSVLIRRGKDVSEASQIDIVYNRPSVFSIGKSEYASVRKKMLENAYRKRLRINGVSDSKATSDLTVDITNKTALSSFPTSEKVELKIAFRSKASRLSVIKILVNDVPVPDGVEIPGRRSTSPDTTVSISLGEGYNRVEVYGVDSKGLHSNHFPLHFQLKRAAPPVAKTFFIGIGIDHFADASHNLHWSVKDIRDLARLLKKKVGPSLVVDTLFNEQVTRENVLKLKKQLLRAGVDDKVIVSYSGHGLLTGNMDYFLSTYPIDFSKPEVEGLPYTIFETLLDNIPARKRLMLIDACHSGEVDPESISSMKLVQARLDPSKKGITIVVDGNRTIGIKSSFELMKELFTDVGKQSGATIISAAAGTQFANEYGDLKNGVFTYSILEAMNEHERMGVNELKRIVSKRVVELTAGEQQPTFRNETLDFDWEVW